MQGWHRWSSSTIDRRRCNWLQNHRHWQINRPMVSFLPFHYAIFYALGKNLGIVLIFFGNAGAVKNFGHFFQIWKKIYKQKCNKKLVLRVFHSPRLRKFDFFCKIFTSFVFHNRAFLIPFLLILNHFPHFTSNLFSQKHFSESE